MSNKEEDAKEAMGSHYKKWLRAGITQMTERSHCYINKRGCRGGDRIGSTLLRYMLLG